MIRLPQLTHHQFAVLSILLQSEKIGKELRAGLETIGVEQINAAFYQMMARLEDQGYIKGRYVITSYGSRERKYKLLPKGRTAHRRSHTFYSQLKNLSH